jgi:hypothetical protein
LAIARQHGDTPTPPNTTPLNIPVNRTDGKGHQRRDGDVRSM